MNCETCNFENPPENLICYQCGEKLYRAKLRISQDSGLNQTHHLFAKAYKIGREPDNDIVIENPSISRCHGEIRFKNGHFYFHDRGSKNGSLINTQRVSQKKLAHLDCIQLGNVIIHFYDENHVNAGIQTEEFVREKFFKFTYKRQTKIKSDDVLLTMLDLAISLLHAEQGIILIYDHSEKLKFKIGKNSDGRIITENEIFELDFGLIKESIESGKTKGVYEQPSTEKQKGGTGHSSWKKIAVPLISTQLEKGNEPERGQFGHHGILGVFYFNQKQTIHSLSTKKKELLGTFAQYAAYAIQNDMLYTEAMVKRKMEGELSLARDIQQRLLPTHIPDFTSFQIASFIHPCEAVGGDYYDFIPISTKYLGIAIGDICGKGVPAALLTATVQAAIRSQLEFTLSPEQIVRNLNSLLIKSTAESIFLTLFFGILDIERSQLKYINAGHPPPIFISQHQTIQELSGTTPALGIIENLDEQETTIDFRPGDLLLLYTDGIIESRNHEKNIFGRKRLLKLVHSQFVSTSAKIYQPDDMVNRIKNDLLAFIDGAEQTDDLTLLAFKRL